MTDLSDELATLIRRSRVPGLAAAAVVNGDLAAVGACGVRKHGAPDLVTPGDKFHLGSCTKAITATLAALLVDEGLVAWEITPPEIFDGEIHPGYRGTTLRQLLTNTGGCPEDIEPDLWGRLWEIPCPPAAQRRELVRGLLREPPAYPPGQGFEYSNAGFSLAGAMLETVAGRSYEDLLREKIFRPLGLNSAGFRAPASPGGVDQPYGHHRRWFRLRAVDPEPAGDTPPAIAPAGAVHMAISDFAVFARAHLGLGDFLSPAQLALLHKPVRDDYAMGWIVTSRPWAGGQALTHVGSNTMFYSVVWLAPHRQFAAVAACNTGEAAGFRACDAAVTLLVEKYLGGAG